MVQKEIGTILINTQEPTELSLRDLYNWVVWQFPRKKGNGLCGAVKPPLRGHSWYPALIRQKDKKIFVHGHLGLDFDSPDSAAEWLATHL